MVVIVRMLPPTAKPIVRLLAAAALLATSVCAAPTPPPEPLFADDFNSDTHRWVVEQQPGGRVEIAAGRMLIEDKAGCTVWFRERLVAPVVITYTATVSGTARVSDLNCFWMASDPRAPADLFAAPVASARNGLFATYDPLQLYYVGYGGNANTTTRFRRYTGGGPKPLLPDHDRREPALLLRADHAYEIRVEARESVARFWRDGELIFEFHDPAPLTAGWFGFRTVDSRLEIRNFRVWREAPPASKVTDR